MCGIVGLVGDWSPDLLAQLNDRQFHRGPDDVGEYRNPQSQVALAMRRLSIQDLAGGHQPMTNEDGSLWIVYNGELFNAPELRPALGASGHTFRTSHSDTECLLHLYEEKGPAMLAELNGFFAFLLYDSRRQQLFGARDRFGIKPLYYTRTADKLACASELKMLLSVPTVGRDLDLQSLSHYLSLQYVPAPGSIFKDVQKLPSAHYFVYDLAAHTFTVSRYWQPNSTHTENHSEDEWAEIIRDELRAAVRRWVLSDVPVACSLSGGLDSSAIVGLLAETNHAKISTYSLGFVDQDESRWNELDLARQVARHWNTDHHELCLTPDDLLKDLVQMVWSLDEPYGGGLPSWYVFQFMAQDVKVGLTGSGGDELFGGYGKWLRYERSISAHQMGFKETLQKGAMHLPEGLIGTVRKRSYREKFIAFAQPMDAYPLYFDDNIKYRNVVAFPIDGLVNTSTWLQTLYQDSGAREMRNGVAYVDMQTQLPEEFLMMTDRFSMAHSLEARVPFLDNLFVDRALGIPPEVRTHANSLKYLLRRAVTPLLPEALHSAPKKGFTIPDTLWLRGKLRPLAERLLAPDRLAKQGLIRPDVYSCYVQPHLEGQADFTGQVWTLLMFQLWHLIFIEQGATSQPTYSWQDLA